MNRRPKATTLRFYKQSLLRVLVHLQQHLDEPLELESLARLAGLSPHHFHHVFTGMVSESLASHVRRLRLERAASRLKRSQTAVVQIALDAGYGTHEAFTRAFRRNFGLSPIQYRRRHGVVARIHAPSGVHWHYPQGPRDFTPAHQPDSRVVIKRLQPMRVAFLRHLGPYAQVGQTWDRLLLLLGKDGWLNGRVQFIGICHDDPAVSPPNKTRYDACVTVETDFRGCGELGAQIIPGGDYAVLTHIGPYRKLGQSYARLLGQWLPRSGRSLRTTPCFEIYFNAPENTAPKDLVTDLHAPLEAK